MKNEPALQDNIEHVWPTYWKWKSAGKASSNSGPKLPDWVHGICHFALLALSLISEKSVNTVCTG